MIDAMKLREYIWQGIRKEVHADKILFYVPFFFGSPDDEPLCLIWDRNGHLSDGGRTISELKKRVGDIRPYLDTIHSILAWCCDCKLVGGQTLVSECSIDNWVGGSGSASKMNRMLHAITLISIVDTVSFSERGEVIL